MNHGGGWRWRNVPLPETHLAALGASELLHRVRPRGLGGASVGRIGGALLVALGVALATSATRAAGTTDLEEPGRLVTHGPYALSRNPMYVGWSLLYLGYAFLFDRAWPLVLFPGLAVTLHREIVREERHLEERFGADYRSFARRVRRYL